MTRFSSDGTTKRYSHSRLSRGLAQPTSSAPVLQVYGAIVHRQHFQLQYYRQARRFAFASVLSATFTSQKLLRPKSVFVLAEALGEYCDGVATNARRVQTLQSPTHKPGTYLTIYP